MTLNLLRTRELLQQFDFHAVFTEELGWSQPTNAHPFSVSAASETFSLTQIAHLAGVVVLEVSAPNGGIPDAKTRAAVHREVVKLHYENLLVFVDAQRTQSLWYWVKREGGKAFARDHHFVQGQPGDLFLGKLSAMVVDISDFDAAGGIPVVKVARRLQDALDVERVTKKFFGEFKDQHGKLLEQISGIDDARDKRWYASVLLNRLMFVYFLQGKGFLPDPRYLQAKLAESKTRGPDRFYSEFLDALFFEGFAKPEDKRSADARVLVGPIRYLNGGLFLTHPIEKKWPNIAIPDVAFDELLRDDTNPKGLFARYSWNLNDAPGGADDEISPDTLGYIFEKYINQKEFGAYYTRPEITEYLCEQTIHRLVLDKINVRDIPGVAPARHFDSLADLLLALDATLCRQLLFDVLPHLSLLDPACGSGAFLVAAMKTLINIYSAVVGRAQFLTDANLSAWLQKTRAEHPSINYFIKREIIKNNLFGVDVMEESTEIAKLRLFLALVASAQSVEQLEPLPNIDFNILAGDSLVGLMHVTADDFDKRASLFRKPYRELVAEKDRLIQHYRGLATFTEDLQSLRDDIADKKREAGATLNDMLLDDFSKLGVKFEQATWDEKAGKEGKPVKRPLQLSDIADDAADLRPFHWGYEFDDVLNRRGGFDAIITNPPWEVFQTDEKEFFQKFAPDIQKNKLRIEDWKKQQADLMADPEIRAAWLKYASRFPHGSAFFKAASQYRNQLSVVNGRTFGGKINLYGLFTEQCFNLLRPGGYCGIVLPSGIYTDLGTKRLREMLFENTKVTGLFGFENRKTIFEGVDSRFKFVVLTFEKGGVTDTFPTAFMRHDVSELEYFPKQGALSMPVELIRRLSPDSLSLMEFKLPIDVIIAEKMLRFPLLGEKILDNWNLALSPELNMTTDSHLFVNSPASGRLLLYEGKMIWQFDSKYINPRYWIDEAEGRKRLLGRRADKGQRLDYQDYRLGFRDIAANTNERTMVASVIPPAFHGNKIPTVKPFDDEGNRLITAAQQLYLAAVWNSFVIDASLRMKVTTTLNFFYIYQLPVPRLTENDAAFWPLVLRAARLICTTPEFDALAAEIGGGGKPLPPTPSPPGRGSGRMGAGGDGVLASRPQLFAPEQPALGDGLTVETRTESVAPIRTETRRRSETIIGATDPTERARLRAEIDGLVAHLYGLTEDEFAHILSTFPLVPDPVKVAAQNAYRDVARGVLP